jgi:hypothetical protein
MNDGVALLLERMKTNPEEFAGDSPTKWKNLVDNYRRYLKKEDLVLLDNGMKELMQQRFTEKVMEELIDPDRKLTREEKIPLAGKTPIQYTADEITNMVEHIDLHKKALGLTPIAGVTQTL